MMKRLHLWSRELSLTQQLMTIIFFVVSVFAVFLVAFLSPQIDDFTEKEMFRILDNAQETVAYYLTKYPDDIPEESVSGSSRVVQEVYKFSTQTLIVIGDTEVPDEINEEILSNINDVGKEEKQYSFSFTDEDIGSQTIYYVMNEIDEDTVLISYMPGSIESQFRSVLTNNIVNLNVMVAIALFVVLTLWVANLIYRLSLIKVYITKIKNDEPALLPVDGKDEIGEVAAALTDMQFELQRQSREKEEMIQNISHDLKTPIATIRSYSESIKDGIYPYGTLEKSIDVIIEHADRLEKKVRSLIALNKMDYLLDECEPGDNLVMADVIDKVLLSLKVIRPEISFETDLDRDVKFHGDEDPWRIVVENIIDNALRYAKSIIRIELREGELTIYNDGSELEEGRVDKLFKPYEKGSNGQFGLGLSIVYKVVTTYGYHVTAENVPGGVLFRIWKDMTRKEQRAAERAKRRNEQEKKKNTKA